MSSLVISWYIVVTISQATQIVFQQCASQKVSESSSGFWWSDNEWSELEQLEWMNDITARKAKCIHFKFNYILAHFGQHDAPHLWTKTLCFETKNVFPNRQRHLYRDFSLLLIYALIIQLRNRLRRICKPKSISIRLDSIRFDPDRYERSESDEPNRLLDAGEAAPWSPYIYVYPESIQRFLAISKWDPLAVKRQIFVAVTGQQQRWLLDQKPNLIYFLFLCVCACCSYWNETCRQKRQKKKWKNQKT